jgi:hypothetical protein
MVRYIGGSDRFYDGVYWVTAETSTKEAPMLREASPKECAREIKRLMEKLEKLQVKK